MMWRYRGRDAVLAEIKLIALTALLDTRSTNDRLAISALSGAVTTDTWLLTDFASVDLLFT